MRKFKRIAAMCLAVAMMFSNDPLMSISARAESSLVTDNISASDKKLDASINLSSSNIYPSDNYSASNYYQESFVNIIPSIKWTTNHAWTTDGKWIDLTDNVVAYGKLVSNAPEDYISVKAGEKYVFSTNRVHWIATNAAHVIFTDDNMKPIKCDQIKNDENLCNKVAIVPEGATRLYITYYCNQIFRVDKITGSVGGKDAEAIAREESELIWEVNKKEESADKEFSYKFDRGKITFVLDDVRGDINYVYDIFKEYGIKNIGVAAIANQFSQMAAGEKTTRGEVVREIVNNGGEVLAHYGDPLIKDRYTKDQIMDRFKNEKEKLESFGYDVNGIILAGGTGFDSIDFSDVEKWARYYYDYSDLYGLNLPYRMGRASLAYSYTTQEKFEEVIDSVIDNKSWMVFYFHDLKEVPEDTLRQRLSYIKAHMGKDLDVVTYKQVNDKFGNKNNGVVPTTYDVGDYLAREDIEGYITYSDEKKLKNGVNQYYTENLLHDNTVKCTDVYISSSTGNDSNPGTMAAPKKTLKNYSKVNDLHIYLKDGDIFDMDAEFTFGKNVSMNSYNDEGQFGVGKRPVISGWQDMVGQWKKTDIDNVWEYDFSEINGLYTTGVMNGNTGMLKINGSVNFERYVFADDVDTNTYAKEIYDLHQKVMIEDNEYLPFWTVDTVNSKIYLYMGVDPNEQDIDYAANCFGMGIGNVSNVGINHIEMTGYSRHGISMSNVSKVNITDCYIHHIGGGLLNERNLVRYGNAIEVWANGKDIYVGENVANWIFDTAYTNQTTSYGSMQEDIVFERNLANRCFWGLESWGDNCAADGFGVISYHNNIVTNICDVTRPETECYYGSSYTNYGGDGVAQDSTTPYISCRSGGYYYSQMAGISAGLANAKTKLSFTRNVIMFSNRYAAIISVPDGGSYPVFENNLFYSSVPNNNCQLVRVKDNSIGQFVFYSQMPVEGNTVITEHGAETVEYLNTLKNSAKYIKQLYEYPVRRISFVEFEIDNDFFENGSVLDCNVTSAKFVYNDGSTEAIDEANYSFDTSAVNMQKDGKYKVVIRVTNPENNEVLTKEKEVEVSSDLSKFKWIEGTADGGKTNWVIYKNGDFYLNSGTAKSGSIVMYDKASDTPWYEYADKIKTVTFNQGYHYAINFFDNTFKITKITINAGITGNLGINNVESLEEIVVKDGVSVASISMKGSNKITSYDFSNFKAMTSSVQTLTETSLEEATFFTMPTYDNALYKNPKLKKITIKNAPESGTAIETAFMHVSGYNNTSAVTNLYVGWAKGEVANAPWGLKGNFIISYKDCDVMYEAGVETKTVQHEFTKYVSDGKVSCTVSGNKTCYCTVCGVVEAVEEPKLGHDYKDGICTRCNDQRTVTVNGIIYTVKPGTNTTEVTARFVNLSLDDDVVIPFEVLIDGKVYNVTAFEDPEGILKNIDEDIHVIRQEIHYATYEKAGYTEYKCITHADCEENHIVNDQPKKPQEANSITGAASYTKIANIKSSQSFKLNVTALSGASSLTFKSNNAKVTVSKTGNVTIAKNFSGKATITVTAGNTKYKTVKKTISICVNPKKVAISSASNTANKKVTVKWAKNVTASGYYVQYSTSSTFAKGNKGVYVTSQATVSKVISGLTPGKKYYFRVKAYKTVGSGKIFGAWSTKKSVVIAKAPGATKLTSLVNSAAGKLTLKWSKNTGATGYNIQYSTSSTFASGNKSIIFSGQSIISKVIANLTKGKTYYVRIRAYKKVGNDKLYGPWSAKKSVKIVK